MPTPGGLPKVGEVWRLAIVVPGRPVTPHTFVVLERGSGEWWSMRVTHTRSRNDAKLYVDCAYWMKMGWLTFVEDAGPETRKALGLPPAKRRRR